MSTGRVISIVGTGTVGRALASALHDAGETIRFGARAPAAARDALQRASPALAAIPVSDIAQAVRCASTIILAVPFAAALKIVAMVEDWTDRILVDATNPVILPDHSGLLLGTITSGAERIAEIAPSAKVVKAFSCAFPEVLVQPSLMSAAPFMPICGDDRAAVNMVIEIARRLGFDGADCGSLKSARYIEPFTMLSVSLLLAGEPRGFAFTRIR
ncbi:NADPH-dependent F420 reductase [Sphingobium sp. HWE2-09]|uniref:NADPH-dependent F420 reductase n=1 Tax=Sphingobium sp. HWE2-09 TaxID=3108390 RepID=UPI002DCD3602|nr:NAD(P)-binding domain-containing protein [Sphingobium sp. HWE2-09]